MRRVLFVAAVLSTAMASAPSAVYATDERGPAGRAPALEITSPPRMPSPGSGVGRRADVPDPGTTPPESIDPGGTTATAARAEEFTPFSHTVPNADGTMTATTYQRPVFRRAGKGWARASGTVKATPADAHVAATAPQALRPVRFGRSKNNLVQVDTGHGVVTWSAPDLKIGRARVAADGVTYEDVAPDADLRIETGPSSVAEQVILHGPAAVRPYTFHLSDPDGALGDVVPKDDGGYRFTKSIGDGVFVEITAAVAYEADDPDGFAGATPGSARMTVTRAGDGFDVTKEVDAGWLAKHSFPIVLDPTLTYSGATPTTDCYVVSDNYSDQGNCGAGALMTGNSLGGDPLGTCGTGTPKWCITRSLLRFNTSNIPVGSVPTSGNLKLVQFKNLNGNSFNVSMYAQNTMYTDSATWDQYNTTCAEPCWSGGTVSTIQDTTAIYADPSSHPAINWQPTTALLQDWINDPATNSGVIMRINPEARTSIGTTGRSAGFYSSEVASSTLWPTLSITYNPPVAPVVTKVDAPATGYSMSGSGAYARGTVVTYTVTMTSAQPQNDVDIHDRVYSGLTLIPSTIRLDNLTCATCVLTGTTIDIPNLDFNPTKTHTLKYNVLVTGNVDWSCAQAQNLARTTTALGSPASVYNLIQVCDQALGLEPWWSYFSREVAAQSSAQVNAANGNLVVQQQDTTAVQARGRLAYVLRRTYNSQETQVAGLLGNMGAGWTLNLAEAGDLAAVGTAPVGLIKPTIGPLTQQLPVVLVDRDGTRHVFTPKTTDLSALQVLRYDSTTSSFVAATTGLESLIPSAVAATVNGATYNSICIDRSYTPPAGVHLSMWRYIAVKHTDAATPCVAGSATAAPLVLGYVTQRTDRVRNEFDAAGRLIDMHDGAGNQLRYVYSTIANTSTTQLALVYEPNSCSLAAALDPAGTCRAFRFGYGTNRTLITSLTDMTTRVAGPITSIVDPAGRTTRYAYDSLTAAFPVLTTVTNPDNTTVGYTYSSGAAGGRCAASASDVSIARQLCQITDERTSTTKFWYVSRGAFVNDMPLIGGVIDRRGTTSTFTYAQVVSATDALAPRTQVTVNGTQVRSWQKRDALGRFAQIQDYIGSTVHHQTQVAWDTGCRFPNDAADNNMCSVTRKAFNDTQTGLNNGIDTPDAVTNYAYNDEGQLLRETRVGSPQNVITTHGYRAQHAQTGGTAIAEDHVTGAGDFDNDPRPASGTQTLYVLSDRIETLRPVGNTASTTVPTDGSEAEYLRYLTTYDVDASATVPPNVRPVAVDTTTDPDAVVCRTATRTNTGLICGEDGPYYKAPASASDRPRALTRYTYDTFGQKHSVRTPKALAEALPGAVEYVYYSDSDTDLSGGTSAGGWLKAVKDPSGSFAAFAYDRAGNVIRTWDRNHTKQTAVSDYPGGPDDPMPGFAETRRGPFTGGTTAAASPWRYVVASRGVLCHWTTVHVDQHGNALRTRPPRGNAAVPCDATDGTAAQPIASPAAGTGAAFDTVQTFTSTGAVTTRQTPAMGTAKSRMTYDAYGNLTSEGDPLADPSYPGTTTPPTRSSNGHVKVYSYDGANRRIATRQARSTNFADVPPNCRGTANPLPGPAPLPANYYYCSSITAYDGLDNVTSTTDADGQLSKQHYDAFQRVIWSETPRNHDGVGMVEKRRAYDADGHMIRECRPRQFGPAAANPGADSVCDASSVYSSSDVYDYSGRVAQHSSRRDASTVVTSYTGYDADGNVITATDPNGTASEFAARTGHTVTFTYDLLGRKLTESTPRTQTTRHTTSWDYDPSGNVTAVTRPGRVTPTAYSRITTYAYDDDNRLTETVAGSDNVVAASAGVTTADGGSNVRTGIRYDADGRVVAKIDPRAYVGRTTAPATTPYVWLTEYDASGQVTAEFAPRFDPGMGANDLAHPSPQSQHCTQGNRPLTAVPGAPAYESTTRVCAVRYGFDAAGNRITITPASSTGSDNRVVHVGVTADNLVESVVAADPANDLGPQITTMRYTYDGTGRQTSSTGASPGNGPTAVSTVTTYTGDGLTATDSTTALSASVTHVTTYKYDLNGNRTGMVDARGETWSTSFTADDLPVTQVNPLGHTTTFGHDLAGNVTSTKSPNANASPTGRAATTTYTYDNLVDATYEPLDPVTGSYRRTRYSYDAGGRQETIAVDEVDSTKLVVSKAGGSQSFTYLPNDRISKETGRDGATLDRSFDAAGHVLSATYQPTSGPAVTTTANYYLDGRVRDVTQSARTTAYAYDGDGKLVTRDEQVGTAHTYTDYTYNGAQLPSAATVGAAGANGTVSWQYDSAGRATAQLNGDGSGWTRTYNNDGTLQTQQVRAGGATNPVVADWRYDYDQLFRVKLQALGAAATATCADNPLATGVQCFDYDDAGRLTKFSDAAGAKVIGYDANSNRTSFDGTTTAYRDDDSILSTTTGAQVKPHEYDAVGRLVNDGSSQSCYDGFDRLLEVRIGGSSCTGSVTHGLAYTYDAFDRQVTRTESGQTATTPGSTTQHYDGLDQAILAEDKPGSSPDVTYGWSTAGPLYAGTAVTAQFLFDDGTGNVSTTLSSNTVQCRLRYDPFGTPIDAQSDSNACSTGSTPSSLLYRASRRDPVSGNYQFGARTYDPKKASFLSADTYRPSEAPAAQSVGSDPLTANRYSYVNGDPVNLIDPSGHRPACIDDSPGGRRQCPNSYERFIAVRKHFGPLGGTDPFAEFGGVAQDEWDMISCEISIVVGCDRSGFKFSVKLPESRPGGLTTDPAREPVDFEGAKPQSRHFTVKPRPGAGKVTIGLFISDCDPGYPGFKASGDCRRFDTEDGKVSGPTHNKAYIEIDFETGQGVIVISPSCNLEHTECNSAYSIGTGDFFGSPGLRRRNRFDVSERKDGTVDIRFDLVNSKVNLSSPIAPSITGTLEFAPRSGGIWDITMERDDYPSIEIYSWRNGYRGVLLQRNESGVGVGMLYGGAPNEHCHSCAPTG